MATLDETMTAAAGLHQAGRIAEAEALCHRIIAIEPRHADAVHLLGALSLQAGRLETAAELISRAIEINDSAALYHVNLGNALRKLGRVPEAMRCYRRAIDRDPKLAVAHYRMGVLQYGLGDYAAAIESLLTAVTLAPGLAKAHAELANALFQSGDLHKAIGRYQLALSLSPENPWALANLGLALSDIGHLDEAVEHCRRALAIRPELATAHNNLGLALLLQGDFANGLIHHEWRLRLEGLGLGESRFNQQPWRGASLQGGTILLHAEQGMGDTLQFLRYAPFVAGRGGRVLLEVQPPLKRIAMSLRGVEQVIAQGEPLPPFDWHCPLMSLPLAFGTTPATIPNEVPYLAPPKALLTIWRERLAGTPGLKVGLVWGGRPEYRRDRARSLALEALAPLGSIDGIALFSLQTGSPAAQVKAPPAGMTLRELEVGEFANTAAIVTALDLVITVDTSTAHLAGALAKPVWVLLSHVPDWRWFMKGEESPWYPTARLFRQPARGAWEPVIAQVAMELQHLAAGQRVPLSDQNSHWKARFLKRH